MSPIQEQLTALGGVFQAAVLVDRIAKTGQAEKCLFTRTEMECDAAQFGKPACHHGSARTFALSPANRQTAGNCHDILERPA